MSTLLTPNTEAVQAATWKALKGKLDDDTIQTFLDATTGRETAGKIPMGVRVSVPAPITATASLYFGLIFGVISCKPSHEPYYFEESSWGIGATAIESGGLLYTAYETWEAFWNSTAYYHAQGIADAGGIFQITFFNKDWVPIGQFNGVAGGIGVFQCGGRGRWHKR